jgi:hypothetical protein
MAVAGLTLFGMVALAAEPEPPLTWKGKGEATFVSEGGTRDLKFDLTLNVDKDGNVSGETSTEDGSAKIERLYYSESVKAEMPRLESRKMILVLSLKTDTPTLIIMNGQALSNTFCYGELRAGRMSAEGLKESLAIGNKEATLMEGGTLPSGVQKALQKCSPIGCYQITGKYVDKG